MTQKKGNEMKRINNMKRINEMKRTTNGLVLAALSLGLLGAAGCAGVQQPAQAAAAPASVLASAPAAAPAEQVSANATFGGAVVSVYRPETRTMYIWTGDPRPNSKRGMSCGKVQLNENPAVAPKISACQ